MLVIFPFEEALYKKAGVPVTWVGHPLMDVLPEPHTHDRPAGLRLGLLPGSRRTEVRRHLPLFLRSAERMLKDFPDCELTVFGAPQIPDAFYNQWLKPWRSPTGGKARLIRETDYYERSRQDLILTSSGTATLENALLGLPMVVVYKLAWPTYLIARALIRVPYIAMANILAGKKLVPELIQGDATPESVADNALEILGDPRKLRTLKIELQKLREKLGGRGAVNRTAEFLLNAVDTPREAAA
jgi:lipid-A-disaccharide synthase